MRKIAIALLAASMISAPAMAQFMGCEIDTTLAKKLPIQAAMTRDISNNLPAAASIQKFTPVPGNQGQTGTCTAWSSTYCAMSMAWAMKNGVTNRATITNNAYLPCYTYVNILTQSTSNCQAGTDIARACEWLKTTGAVKLSNYPQNPACINTRDVPSNWKTLAAQHRLPSYTKLFFDYQNLASKVTATKRAIANGHPVVMAINCATSLCNSKGLRSDGLWWPVGNETPSVNYGGHALVVVAYDDNKFNGGAFLIQNSWGENWGYKGYFWITYYHYACWVYYAFELNVPMAQGLSVDRDCNHLNFGTSRQERDYPNDIKPKPDYNKPDNNRPDNNPPNNGFTKVDNDFLKFIADQYGIDYNDYIKNKDKYNKPKPNDNKPKPSYDDNNYDDGDDYYDDYSYDGDDYDDDNDDYNDYSDNDYNRYYDDGDDGSYDYDDYYYGGDDDDDEYYDDDDDEDYYEAYNQHYYGTRSYAPDQSYSENMKSIADNGKTYDEDNTYDEEFNKTSKLKIETPDGRKLTVSKLSGNIKLMLNDGSIMPGHVEGNVIKIDKTYKSGTRFRVYVGNNQPAYVYVFGTDLTNQVYNIFPQSKKISPFLCYKNSRVALPDEEHWIEMDATAGTDYLYVLYSLVPLNIDEIQKEVGKIKGDYSQKLFTVMGPKSFTLQETNVEGKDTFKFNAMTVNKKTLGVVIELKHAN